MNWKSYVFCAVVMIAAIGAWMRPTIPAAAADPPTKFEYKPIDATSAADTLSQLNAAGDQRWKAVGLVCLSSAAGNSGFGCAAETLLVREKM